MEFSLVLSHNLQHTQKNSLVEFDYAIILHTCHNSRFKKPVDAKALKKNVNKN